MKRWYIMFEIYMWFPCSLAGRGEGLDATPRSYSPARHTTHNLILSILISQILQNKALEKQTEVLKKNISVLFKTAQVEIERKNEEIKQLRRKACCAINT